MEDDGRTRFTERVSVVTKYPEVIGGATRRSLPLVPRTVSLYPVCQVDQLAYYFDITSVPF